MLPTIIILPGWEQTSADWREVKEMLEKNERVVVIDLPGFGVEPLVSGDWLIIDYANWVLKKIEECPGDKIILGHSFGGRIASFIASSNPIWLKGLILYAAPCIYRPTFKTKLIVWLAKIAKQLKMNTERFNINSELQRADGKGMGNIFRKAVVFDQTEIIKNIKTPTLLIWGANDKVVPLSIANEMVKTIPGSELFVMDNAGHHAHKENIYLFYGVIEKFIKGC